MRSFLAKAALGAALIFAATQADAQTSYTFPDFGGTSRTAGASGSNCSGVICPLAVPTDGSGNALGGATGAAVPPGAVYLGINSGGNLTGWNGAITVASGGVASGAIASGAVASGAYASGAFASGAFASGSISDGANVTQGAKADAKSTATDTTAVTIMQVMKEISFMEQTPASRAVTNAGTFATQSAITAASGSIASGAIASGAIASGAVASGAVASGAFASGSISDGAMVTLGAKADAKSTATDTTSVTIMQVLKEISAVTQLVATDPCTTLAKTSVAISQTGTAKLVTKTSAKKNYICSIMVVGADAENISLVEGTKVSTECDTSTAAIIGSTTAGNGPNLAANGGFTLGSGGYTIAAGANNNFDVCLFQSGSGRVAGVLTYVQQ
jgi:hypothetical protein